MKKTFLILFSLTQFAHGGALDDYLFAKNEAGRRAGARTEGVLIIKDGKIIYEKYDRGYDKNKKHIMWSISKTVTALLYGVALKEKVYRARSIHL